MSAIQDFLLDTGVNLPPAQQCFGFEGVEKKLEIDFKKIKNNKLGLRVIPRACWEEVLDIVKCKILNMTKNAYFDAYVLSESSLFVYPYKVMLKTCGTTVTLRCLDRLMELVKEHVPETSIEFCFFSRRNLLFPDRQIFPHTNFEDEVAYLNKAFGTDGEAYVFGPNNAHQWHLYFVDYSDKTEITDDVTLEIMMTDLDRTVMEQFYKSAEDISAKEITRSAGISNLIPGQVTDEYMFDPCGYSMNGLFGDVYSTIHITPEAHCSFVSFETNVKAADYTKVLNDVIAAFKPGRFTVSLFADSGALCGPSTFNAFNREIGGFTCKSNAYHEFEGQYNVTVSNYVGRDFIGA
jgi:S-adenosylmethionine decarboxylase|eukprot:TRINITY_DN13216_c0_g1_i1.p1 TRINITY_DN13216_c0_g1~~TRINITY_DN13216_c0_g1_i1.p1  ORF type:complete len:350 (+),score=85.47 TRINITY_DN13216_c0_g1_i1:283-1332(+)